MDKQPIDSDIISYDYIIAGAGCAGLSLLYHFIHTPLLAEKSILVIDQNLNKSNDRTWCFWESETGLFEDLVKNSWGKIAVLAPSFQKELSTAPFTYKMIQGLDYYEYIQTKARQFKNISWLQTKILSIQDASNGAIVSYEGGKAHAAKIFSSILPFQMHDLTSANKFPLPPAYQTPFLWQHFKGKVLKFEKSVFKPNIARLMDFNVPQKEATAFMYMLPLNEKEALVEYTLFSETILAETEYDAIIAAYVTKHYPDAEYTTLHEEMGAIPMTQFNFSISSKNIFPIGALGAAVKASTGYAFHFIQLQSKQIVKQLVSNKAISTKVHTTRHQFYDAVLLYILQERKMPGAVIFKKIFEKNAAATVFKFLSNTSTFWEDIQIMKSLPTNVFLPAALHVLLRR
jgi:lycopene beta-cyclase